MNTVSDCMAVFDLLKCEVMKGFFRFVDSKYFDNDSGTWDDMHPYGTCTYLNSSMVWLLEAAGRDCKMFGAYHKVMQQAPKWDHHCGHDWLLVDDRYAVDLWVPAYLNPTETQVVWDMQTQASPYLPAREAWEPVPLSVLRWWVNQARADWGQYLETRYYAT